MSSALVFADYDAALAWIDERSVAHGGRNRFLSSDEYRDAAPAIRGLYEIARAKGSEKTKALMRDHGVQIGDLVVYAVTSGFGMGTVVRGRVYDKGGYPHVRLDDESAAEAGKRTVRWGPHWQRVRTANPYTYAGVPERFRDRIEDAVLEEQIWRSRVSEYELRGDRWRSREARVRMQEATRRVACLELAIASGSPADAC